MDREQAYEAFVQRGLKKIEAALGGLAAHSTASNGDLVKIGEALLRHLFEDAPGRESRPADSDGADTLAADPSPGAGAEQKAPGDIVTIAGSTGVDAVTLISGAAPDNGSG